MGRVLNVSSVFFTAFIGCLAGTCSMSPDDPRYEAYARDASKQVPGWEVVDLDLPPEERWQRIVAPRAQEIQAMIDAAKSSGGKAIHLLLNLLERAFGGVGEPLLNALPLEYAREIKGIQIATNISAIELFVYNIMYEISGACTSVVAQDASGNVVHARNLDFGPKELAAKLRPLLMNVKFMKGGKVLFRSVSYAGYIGCLTCMKEQGFSLSVNTRSWSTLPDLLPGGLIEWILGIDRSGHFLTFMTRDVLQEERSYADATERVNSTKLLGPAYIILAGVQAGEGAVITRDSTHSLHYWSLAEEAASKGRPFILETNFDHWDRRAHDRRDNGNACMAQIVANATVDFKNMFQVMSSRPTRNDGTTYTSLLSPRHGRMESYIQHCCNGEDLAPSLIV